MDKFDKSIDHLSERELLLLTVQKLDTTIESVAGTNARLDKLNGSVGKHQDKLVELDKWRSSVDGALKTWKLILGSGGLFAVIAFLFETVYH